jgi:iron complex transport system ATP-binding protein
MTLLCVKNLSLRRRNRDVLKDISFEIGAGELVGLIGPNGAGKTTLMRAALGMLPSTGISSLAQLSARDRARAVAWMPQAREIAWPVTVETLVTLGRLPHLAQGQKPSLADREAIEEAMGYLDLTDMRDRTATRLSGGEQARVLLARALAQQTPLLMADEPTAGLDPSHQISTMQTFSKLARAGTSVIVSLHDLGLAARHCTRLIVIDDGTIVADGPPAQVLTPDLIRSTFSITAWYETTDQGIVFQPLEVVT